MIKKFALTLLCSLLGIINLPAHSHHSDNDFALLEMGFEKTNWQINHDLFALHIIPKCGTHFMERTIQLMTGQFSANYNLSKQTLETTCQNNLILRSFQPYTSELASLLKDNKHKLISVIRDPRDALVSHVFYMRSYLSRLEGVENKRKRDFFTVSQDFDSLSLEDQITLLIEGSSECMSYIDFYKERIGWALNPRHLVVKYEELLPNEGGGKNKIQRNTVRRVADFINLDLSQDEIDYVIENMYVVLDEKQLDDGRVFERAITGNWQKFLNKKHKKLIKKKLGKEIIKLGYAADNNW